jgi:hypothetical protein
MLELIVGFLVALMLVITLGALLFILNAFTFAFFVTGVSLIALALLASLGQILLGSASDYPPDWMLWMIFGGIGLIIGAALVGNDDFR